MEAIHDQRRLSSLRRVPPRGQGFAAAIAADASLGGAGDGEEGDPPVRYFVRVEGRPARISEIATPEDWRELERQLFDEERAGVEVWAQSAYDAILIFPPDRSELPDIALDLLALKMNRAVAADPFAFAAEAAADAGSAGDLWTDDKLLSGAYRSPGDDDLFAPEYHGQLTVGEAKEDFERIYRERMGQDALSPVKPDGPATRAA